MSRTAHIRVGIVVARETTSSPWEPFAWRIAEAIYPAPEMEGFALLRDGPEGQLFLAGSIDMELHRREAASYLDNLSGEVPSLYVVLRKTEDGEPPLELHLVTASLTDVHAYGGDGDEVVGPVPMPRQVQEFVGAFAAEHYAEEPFVKRRREKHNEEQHELFGQEPIFERRARDVKQRGGREDE